MFNLFRKKSPEPARQHLDGAAVLALSNSTFVDLCVKSIRGEQPGANAMVVVAFNALRYLLPLCAYALKSAGKDTHHDNVFRTTFDGLNSIPTDEVNRRRREALSRALWFHELMRREEFDPALHAAIVGIWGELAISGQCLEHYLSKILFGLTSKNLVLWTSKLMTMQWPTL